MKVLREFEAILGEEGVLTGEKNMERYLREWRGRYRSRAAAVLLPATTEEVSELIRICAREGVGVVPQGGNTGLCGAAVANEHQVILNLERMTRIREVNAAGAYMTAEAGCILSDLQRSADNAGRLFPLSLSAEGSCQIGGNLSTDAGGINVLRYGTARDQVLGLEVVLADGQTWNGLRSLRKNTAGYDLRNLFIGAEGTLGIITAATLKLFPAPADVAAAMVALADCGSAVPFLAFLRERLGQEINAFELISDRALRFVVRHIPDARNPFQEVYKAFVLVETTADREGEAASRLEACLREASERRLIRDAAMAADGRRREALWRLRHNISEAQRHEGISIKHDISVPIHRIGEFLEKARDAVRDVSADIRPVIFGHVGDGNLHYNLSQPKDSDTDAFAMQEQKLNEVVFGLVSACGGSFSAEHGVGLLRRPELRRYVDPVEVKLMESIKQALDPQGILNPGKVL